MRSLLKSKNTILYWYFILYSLWFLLVLMINNYLLRYSLIKLDTMIVNLNILISVTFITMFFLVKVVKPIFYPLSEKNSEVLSSKNTNMHSNYLIRRFFILFYNNRGSILSRISRISIINKWTFYSNMFNLSKEQFEFIGFFLFHHIDFFKTS